MFFVSHSFIHSFDNNNNDSDIAIKKNHGQQKKTIPKKKRNKSTDNEDNVCVRWFHVYGYVNGHMMMMMM